MRFLWGACLAVVIVMAGAAADAGPLDEAKQHYQRGLAAYALGNYTQAASEYEQAFAIQPDPALLYNAAQAYRLSGNSTRALFLYQNYLRLFGSQVLNRAEVERHIRDLKLLVEQEKKTQNAPPTEPQPVGKSPPPSVVPTPATREPAPTPMAREPAPTTREPIARTPATPPRVAVVTPTPTPKPITRPVEIEPKPAPVEPKPAPVEPGTVDLTPPARTDVVVATAPPENKPIWKKGWFWGVIGGAAAVVIGVGVGVGIALSSGDKDPTPSYGSVTLR
jgi:Tetratricopeptide repeat